MEYGDRGVLEYGDFPEPEVDSDEVLVNVKVALLSYLDIWMRRGFPGIELRMPHIPGSDMAGVITEVSERATRFETGGHIALIMDVAGGGDELSWKGDPMFAPGSHTIGEYVRGVHAEFAAIPEENLVPVLEGVSWEVVDSASPVFQAARWMFVDRGELRPDEKMFAPGTSGGVGHATVQIADYAGAEVYATTLTDERLEYAGECSADHVISYKEDDFSEEIQTLTDSRGVDMIVDHAGEATYKQSFKSLVKGDHVVICGATTDPDPGARLNYIFWNQLSAIGSTMTTPGGTDEVLGLVWDGTFEPRICGTLPMNETDHAHELTEERQGLGKAVII